MERRSALFQWLCEVTGYWQELERGVLQTADDRSVADISIEFADHAKAGIVSSSRSGVQIYEHGSVLYHAAT